MKFFMFIYLKYKHYIFANQKQDLYNVNSFESIYNSILGVLILYPFVFPLATVSRYSVG